METEMVMHRDDLLKRIETLEIKNQELARLVARRDEEYEALSKLVRRIADNAPDMIWAKDMDNRYLFANRALCDRLLMCKPPKPQSARMTSILQCLNGTTDSVIPLVKSAKIQTRS